jgi:hypothetical protein
MRFFEKFFGSDMNTNTLGEATVLCPFPHYLEDGSYYKETNASAHINTEKGLFHCKNPNCQSWKLGGPKGGLSEPGFMAVMQGLTYGEATRLLAEMSGNERSTSTWDAHHENLKKSEVMMGYVDMLGLDAEFVEEYNLGYRGNGIVFPAFVYGEYMGSCDYNPYPLEGNQKAVLDTGMGQVIWPFDIWREDDRDTFLCAGFKDAAIARKNGLNAITFSHGEGSFPKLYKRSFKGRKVFICYDNDQGGREGALRAATLLKEAGASPFVVDISIVCAEKGEDIHNFFIDYEKTSEDLLALAEATEPFSEELYEKERNRVYPLVTLEESVSGKVVGQVISSRIMVNVEFTDTKFRVPDVVEIEKFNDEPGALAKGDKRHFYLEERNIESILKLMDSGLKETDIDRNLKIMCGIPGGEKGVAVRKRSWTQVQKVIVTDDVESQMLDDQALETAYSPLEMTMYALGDDKRLKNGEKYRIFYKAVTHPLKAAEVVGIITNVEASDTSVNSFRVNEEVLESVKCFQVQEGETVKEKMEELYQRSKAFLGPEANRPVFFTTELFYHTPLDFMFDDKRKERGYLEPMIVGESRTHKSATSKGLLEMYELGTFISLKTASTPGLIGGSKGSSGSGYKTRLGIIPRNHRGAVILEEFSGADPSFIKSMTDIRSSNVVRITRVDSTVTAPAKVRMLTLSNVKTRANGTGLPLRDYPSGVKVLLELIGAAEDVARYDFFLLKGEGEEIGPTTPVESEAYPKESYMNRVRWIWSRKAENVKFDDRLRAYIMECTRELNQNYSCHIQFFGREAWKKLSRVAIAVAACVCSYDETGENLKVTEEHVTWAKNFLVACYDNEIFRLKRYVEEERSYTVCDTTDVQVLQGIFNQSPALVKQLDMGTEFTHNQLQTIAGLDKDKFGTVMSRLTEARLIKMDERISPSAKFRIAVRQIKDSRLKRVGER